MPSKPNDIPDTFLNIAEAVKTFDVSRSTLQRAIKSGVVSFKISKKGKQDKYLDPATLAQHYSLREKSDTGITIGQNTEVIHHDTPSDIRLLEYKISVLEKENKAVHEQFDRERDEYKHREEDLRREKERLLTMLESEQQKTQTLMLEYKPDSDKPAKPSRWERLGTLAYQTGLVAGLLALIVLLALRGGLGF